MSSLYSRGNEEQESIYPPTVKEIADAQQSSTQFKEYFRRGGELPAKYEFSYIDSEKVLTEKGRMLIPKSLHRKILDWYHHYLMHPGHDRLERTIKATMTWGRLKGSVHRYTKRCPKCQKFKHTKNQYGKMPEKQVKMTP